MDTYENKTVCMVRYGIGTNKMVRYFNCSVRYYIALVLVLGFAAKKWLEQSLKLPSD